MSVKLISADSHVNPPPDLWLRDAPARLEDRVPRVESTPEGDVWVVDQKASPVQGLTFMGGRDYKDYTPRVAYREMRPGSWDPQARLADMDQDGIWADVLYGGGPSRFDEPELRAFCTQRYNDWLFELERASGETGDPAPARLPRLVGPGEAGGGGKGIRCALPFPPSPPGARLVRSRPHRGGARRASPRPRRRHPGA